MNSLTKISLTAVSFLALFLGFTACQKSGPSPTQIQFNKDFVAMSALINPIVGIPFRNVYNLQNGVRVKADSCNIAAHYTFGAKTRPDSTSGFVTIDYRNSPCAVNYYNKNRGVQPPSEYSLFVHPNQINFTDNGFNSDGVFYNIIKMGPDSLILQMRDQPSFIKVYLPAN